MEMAVDAKKLFLVCAEQCTTISEAAIKAGVSPQIQGRIAKGGKIRSSTLGRLAKVLKVAPADLLKDDQ